MYFGFKDISISYGKKEILKNVTLEFEKGTINTIIGKNGCGKSSLLKTLTKKVPYKTGQIFIKGCDIKKIKRKEVAKTIAYLPQIHKSPDDITVRTLVSYGRFPHQKFGHSLNANDKKIIDDALEASGITEFADREVGTLSGGEAQRAWIAMCIAQEPEILILDEPTTHLDICYQVEVLELVKKLNQDLNITVVMVLHDINLAARYSDYLFAIKDGIIYDYGKPNEIIDENKLEDLFNIRAKIIRDEEHGCPFFIPQKIEKENENEKNN